MSKKIVIVQKKESSGSEGTETSDGEELMSFDREAINDMDQANFEEMYEQSFTEMGQGEIITGQIVGVQGDGIFVDVGYKSEGKINPSEFDGEVQIGDKVQVMVVKMEDEEGNLVLSKKKADMNLGKKLIEESFSNGKPVEGRVNREIKGGYIVDLGGFDAFLPGSQVDLRRGGPAKDYIGNKYQFKIAKYEPSKDNIVISRKAFLEEELKEKRKDFFDRIKEGDVVRGKIKSVLDYGAFIDLEGTIDGFVHLKDVSWSHIKNCQELLSEGVEVEAKVLKVDLEQQKINLGLKHLTEDPWEAFCEEHNQEDVINGEVVRLTDFGAFVRFTDGVEGLIHIKELSWTKRINHPKEVLKVGDHLKAMILEMDVENRKLSLSLKQVLDNPWDDIDEHLPVGRKVVGKVKNVTDFGVFIELDNELVGLLHKNDVDWSKKAANLKKDFKKGKTVDVIILETNKEKGVISLGLKQLLENPLEIFRANHPKGSLIDGKIIKVLEIGVVADLGDGMEGFLHASEINKKREQSVESLFKVGDKVNAVVKNIDIKKNKIALSTKDYERQLERKTIDQYLVKGAGKPENETVTLGDLFKFDDLK